MNPRQVQLKVDFSSAKSNWTVKIASNSNWTAILASQLQLKLDFCTANSNWRLKIAGRSGREGRGGATRAKLYFGMSITRLIVLVLCICAGLAKIATAYVVQTHDTKEL